MLFLPKYLCFQPSYPQRHIPGPITKERLEAAERGNEPAKRNMLPLVRSDKKSDLKKLESQVILLQFYTIALCTVQFYFVPQNRLQSYYWLLK